VEELYSTISVKLFGESDVLDTRIRLVEQLGIEASRLKTNGLGSSQPTASNDTKEGRAENRRVELVRL
jgi:flagellar motor protein MotB